MTSIPSIPTNERSDHHYSPHYSFKPAFSSLVHPHRNSYHSSFQTMSQNPSDIKSDESRDQSWTVVSLTPTPPSNTNIFSCGSPHNLHSSETIRFQKSLLRPRPDSTLPILSEKLGRDIRPSISGGMSFKASASSLQSSPTTWTHLSLVSQAGEDGQRS